jgi:hypothetical protein
MWKHTPLPPKKTESLYIIGYLLKTYLKKPGDLSLFSLRNLGEFRQNKFKNTALQASKNSKIILKYNRPLLKIPEF